MLASLINSAQNNPRVTGLYACFGLGCLFMYRNLTSPSRAEHDHVLTLSALLQTLAFALLVHETRNSVGEGLSEKTLWALFTAQVTRLSTTFWGQGYVPEDNTSEMHLYQLAELAGVLLLFFQILKLTTARSSIDVGQSMERWHYLMGLAAVSMALAWYTKSTGHNDYFADLSWMFSIWMEAFALVPQIQLLRSGAKVDESALHFICLSLTASVVFALFWAKQTKGQVHEGTRFVEGILAAAAIRVMLCSCYLYYFHNTTRNKSAYEDACDEEML